VDESEIRYRLTSALLQAEGPLSLDGLAKHSGVGKRALRPVLAQLVTDRKVAEGPLAAGSKALHYRWAARWHEEAERRAAASRQDLLARMQALEARHGERFGIDDEPAAAFHRFIIGEYVPPKEKRFLVFFQCSVRRPFYSSPSHGTIRRSIATATGYDPYHDFAECPVHVVVLASRVGPAPYELQDVYPVNVRSGGVKHFGPEHYAEVRPVLARRMAEYLATHGANYAHVAAFADGRYAEVLRDAMGLAGTTFCVFPDPEGVRVVTGRKYWDKFWIQLYREVVSWLEPEGQKAAQARLRKLKLTIR